MLVADARRAAHRGPSSRQRVPTESGDDLVLAARRRRRAAPLRSIAERSAPGSPADRSPSARSRTAIMPQPMSTPTAAGMIAPLVGITEPTVAPMPKCTSGITATWLWMNGSHATFASCVARRVLDRHAAHPGLDRPPLAVSKTSNVLMTRLLLRRPSAHPGGSRRNGQQKTLRRSARRVRLNRLWPASGPIPPCRSPAPSDGWDGDRDLIVVAPFHGALTDRGLVQGRGMTGLIARRQFRYAVFAVAAHAIRERGRFEGRSSAFGVLSG